MSHNIAIYGFTFFLDMSLDNDNNKEKSPGSTSHQTQTPSATNAEEILCPHCLRTASNGIKCKGICVADNDY